MLTLKKEKNRNSRGYVTKLGFDQYLDSVSSGESRVTARLDFQLGKGPSSTSSQWVRLQKLRFHFTTPGSKLISSICEQMAALVSC